MLKLKGSEATSRMMPFTEPYHIHGFTKKSICRLAESVGLSVEFLMCKYTYGHIERYKHPFSLLRFSKRQLFGAFHQFSDALDCGINMEVMCTKKQSCR